MATSLRYRHHKKNIELLASGAIGSGGDISTITKYLSLRTRPTNTLFTTRLGTPTLAMSLEHGAAILFGISHLNQTLSESLVNKKASVARTTVLLLELSCGRLQGLLSDPIILADNGHGRK